jgi:hypothetical protein
VAEAIFLFDVALIGTRRIESRCGYCFVELQTKAVDVFATKDRDNALDVMPLILLE